VNIKLFLSMFGIWLLVAVVSFLFVAVPRVSGDGTSDFPNGVIFSFESDAVIYVTGKKMKNI